MSKKTDYYVCQQCGARATIEGEQAIDPSYDTPFIAKWVACQECGYTIPKADADVAILLEACKDAVKTLHFEGLDAEMQETAIAKVKS